MSLQIITNTQNVDTKLIQCFAQPVCLVPQIKENSSYILSHLESHVGPLTSACQSFSFQTPNENSVTRLQPSVKPKQFGTFLPESDTKKLLDVFAFMFGFINHECPQKVSFKNISLKMTLLTNILMKLFYPCKLLSSK